MRHFLVKNFWGVHTYNIFGVHLSGLRATRFGMPIFLIFMASVILQQEFNYPWAQVPALIFLGLFVLYCWITFPWVGLGYFELWPVKFSEMDAEQAADDEHNKEIENQNNMRP